MVSGALKMKQDVRQSDRVSGHPWRMPLGHRFPPFLGVATPVLGRSIVLTWFYQQSRKIGTVAVGAILRIALFPLYLHVIKTPGTCHWFL